MNFIPSSKEDTKAMLDKTGAREVGELFSAVPVKLNRELGLPLPLNEMEVRKEMEALAEKNKALKCFRGAGAYNHFIPAAVDKIVSRSEFYTAYTPYQAEISQGTLQAIYEYQTFICLLTGMDVANASMYDGATALAEAALLAHSATKKTIITVAEGLNPNYAKVLKTYCNAADLTITQEITPDSACVIAQYPDFYGRITGLAKLEKKAHDNGALFIVCVTEPLSLALLKPPGDFNADVVVGEGQSFGNAMSFGGPLLGIMAVKNDYAKKIPGRLSGMTTDAQGRRGFVLTLQAREQHIRREKATSNICSNEALCALTATAYLALMGPKGLRNAAAACYENAHYLHDKLAGLGFKPVYDVPFFNEFVVESPIEPAKLNEALAEKGVLGGLPLEGNKMLWCCTELNSRQEIDELVKAVGDIV